MVTCGGTEQASVRWSSAKHAPDRRASDCGVDQVRPGHGFFFPKVFLFVSLSVRGLFCLLAAKHGA